MRGDSVKRSVGVELYHKIKQSRVLLVGAGGIGCELLKDLLLTGFGEIHIIDLDTIDLSNLNRQFLFRHEHIKQPKALVAKKVAHKFQPGAILEAYHADIMDPQFNVDWFKTFNVVFNALDNLKARRHVNRMCLAARVPLVESGTTGFNGQVQVIKKGDTECYDCNPKETPKSFAVCTIRSTPSQPIHCIVWAKSYLFPELFGISEDDDPELDTSENAENAEEIEMLRREAHALKEIRQSMGSDDFFRKVFDKVFQKDIERLRGMEDMWKTRKRPEVLDMDKLQAASTSIEPTISSKEQKVWSPAENFAVFKDSLDRLSSRLKSLQKTSSSDGRPTLEFDKDDVDTLDFVTAAANLRAANFDIEPKSKFDTKQMAGNIIPAIATTNAMTAGLCVLQSFKVLQDDLSQAKMVFLEKSGARAINSESLNLPNPSCPVCSEAQGRISVDLARATLADLVEKVLRSELGYREEFSISSDVGLIYDPDLEDNLSKKLSDLGIKDNTFVTVIDEEDQDPRVNLTLLVVGTEPPSADSQPITLKQVDEIPHKAKPAVQPTPEPAAQPNGTTVTGKRKREGEDEDITPSKRVAHETVTETNGNQNGGTSAAAANGNSAEPIILDEIEEGAILIDD